MRTAGTAAHRRVLVVEDEYFVALLVEDVLAKIGHAVVGPLATVAAALAALEADRPDAALLDANLRGECAAPVARKLAADGIPFAFVTGYIGSASPAAGFGVPWLSKPFTAEQLAELVHRLLPDRRQE